MTPHEVEPLGRSGEIQLTRSAAKVFKGPARFQNIEQALSTAPMFYADLVESIGSDDGPTALKIYPVFVT